MTDSQVDLLATHLGRLLGRRVMVHRSQDQFKKPGAGGRMILGKGPIKYAIGIEGSYPPVFFGMTVNEAKARLAMIADLVSSGVVKRSEGGTGNDAESGRSEGGRALPQGDEGSDAPY